MNLHATPEPPTERTTIAESMENTGAPGNPTNTVSTLVNSSDSDNAGSVSGDGDAGMSLIVKAVAVVGIVNAVAVGYFAGRAAGASAAFGATVGLGNLLVLGRMVRAFLGRGGDSMPWVVAALTKLAVLLLAMYLPVRAGLVQVLPFVIGFGALPLGIVLGQLLTVPPKSKEN